MQKIFLLLITLITFSFSATDDCKTDVYFGNGILTKQRTAIDNSELLRKSIIKKFGLPYFNKNIGKVAYAYNQTEGVPGDLLESLAQKLENSVISYLPYIGQISTLLNITTAELQNSDVELQVAQYRASIEGGNKVLLVAHSQGNFFGKKALINLTQNPKNFWMGNYFEAVSVASPMLADIKNDTPRIDWDNDIVSAIAVGISDGYVKNPIRKIGWKALRPLIGLGYREKRPDDSYVFKSQVGGKSPKGHWESSEDYLSYRSLGGFFGGLDVKVHAFTFYMGEPLAERNFLIILK